MKNKLTLITLLLTGGLAYAQTMGSFTDARNGQTYKTVSYEDPLLGAKITIMAENLNYKIAGSYAYDNNEQYRKNLGLLYTWRAAMKACPSGWHLPSDSEWDLLVNRFGGASKAGAALKSTSGWKDGGSGTNSSGFNAMPAGSCFDGRAFCCGGLYGVFWSSTEGDGSYAWDRLLLYSSSEVYRDGGSKDDAYSCRCVRD